VDWVLVVTFGQLQQHAGSPELASFLLLAICFFTNKCMYASHLRVYMRVYMKHWQFWTYFCASHGLVVIPPDSVFALLSGRHWAD